MGNVVTALEQLRSDYSSIVCFLEERYVSNSNVPVGPHQDVRCSQWYARLFSIVQRWGDIVIEVPGSEQWSSRHWDSPQIYETDIEDNLVKFDIKQHRQIGRAHV